MKKLAVLISNHGTGTNLQAIIDGIESGKINGKIVVVISAKEDAYGLVRAKKHNLPIELCPTKDDLFPLLQKYQVDYICLGGWKQFIADNVMDAFENRILNVHPGLIPDTIDGTVKNPDGTDAIWNKGKFTDKAMQNFLDNHATYAGCSVHFLTKEFDFGPVLERGFEKIDPSDTTGSLYTRVKKKENEIYVEALIKLCKE